MTINYKAILTVGADWKTPKGGVAQVMANYADYIFGRDNFKCVVNSGGNNILGKILKAITGISSYFKKLTFDRDIQIVHIHTASYNSFRRAVVYMKIAQWYGKKVILHIHGGGFREFYQTNPAKILKQLQAADGLAVLSKSWKEFFTSIKANKNIHVINNLIPEPKLLPIKPHNEVRLLFLGAICDAKGIFDLLDVINDNKNQFRGKLELHIGGNGETLRLINYIESNELQDIVIFHGWVSGDKKVELLNECDVFILPSYTEGLPLSILEALSYGKPVLSTPVGGIPEVVDENVGILIRPGDKDELKIVLQSIISGDNKNKKVILATAKLFLPNSVKEQLETFYTVVSE